MLASPFSDTSLTVLLARFVWRYFHRPCGLLLAIVNPGMFLSGLRCKITEDGGRRVLYFESPGWVPFAGCGFWELRLDGLAGCYLRAADYRIGALIVLYSGAYLGDHRN